MAEPLSSSALPPLPILYGAALGLEAQASVTVGTLTTIARAVQKLRENHVADADLRRAEDISALAHRLANARRTQGAVARNRVAELVHAIDTQCWQGLMALPIGAMR